MKVTVDALLCQGHGRCYELAPATFLADEQGMARVVLGPWTQSRAAAAVLGSLNCPEGAISVEPDLADI